MTRKRLKRWVKITLSLVIAMAVFVITVPFLNKLGSEKIIGNNSLCPTLECPDLVNQACNQAFPNCTVIHDVSLFVTLNGTGNETPCTTNNITCDETRPNNCTIIQVVNQTCNNALCPKCNSTVVQVTCTEMEDFAEEFARLYVSGEISEIYDLLTDEKKAAISKADFVKHYPAVVYGVSEVAVEDKALISRTKKNNAEAMLVESVKTNDSGTYVQYVLLKDDGTFTREEPYKFVKEDDKLKIDAFNVLVYASCTKTCKASDILLEGCREACLDRSKFSPLKEDKPFECKNEVCSCRCWNGETGFFVEPIIS